MEFDQPSQCNNNIITVLYFLAIINNLIVNVLYYSKIANAAECFIIEQISFFRKINMTKPVKISWS